MEGQGNHKSCPYIAAVYFHNRSWVFEGFTPTLPPPLYSPQRWGKRMEGEGIFESDNHPFSLAACSMAWS